MRQERPDSSARPIVAATAAIVAVLSIGLLACGSSAQLSAAGGPCNVVTDCQDGLVCCNEKKGSLTCVSQVACLVPSGTPIGDASMVPMGVQPDALAPPGDALQSPPDDGSTQQPMPEAAPPETGSPPPVDAGKPEASAQEASVAPPKDASAPADATAD